tara:strand:+ start:535 stop:726 length:192 start_codon:yes stop_codon:yes gene_type:complete
MKSICIKNIPVDLYEDLIRLKELSGNSITSMFLEGVKLRGKELGTQIAENRKRRNTLKDMAGF